MIGLHDVQAHAPVGVWPPPGQSADIGCLVDDISIQHGRSESTGQPDASTATLNLSANPELAWPPFDIGWVITVHTYVAEAGGSYTVRFTGQITDIAAGWDDAGTDTPNAGVVQLVCVGKLATLGRRVVGSTPFPQELDGARVQRVIDLCALYGNPVGAVDPGTVQILARDIDSSNALDVIHDVAASAGGILWEDRGGAVRYADADHRRNLPVALALDACDVLVTPSWQRNVDGIVNEVSIGYGVAPEGGEQPRYYAKDDASIGRYGRWFYTYTTELAALADAQAMGELLMVRNIAPVWILAALPLDVEGLDAAQTAAMLDLDMHSLISVTGLPALGGVPTTAVLWVEGWTERLAWGVHEIELYVSGFCRTSPPPRWNDVSPAWAWDTVTPPSLTWNDVTCFGPSVPRDIWDSIPASTRWDDIAASVLWDTYTPVLVEG